MEECERRDPKGQYAKARAGLIADFTGVSAPYGPPPSPELRLETGHEPLEQTLATVTQYVEEKFLLECTAKANSSP